MVLESQTALVTGADPHLATAIFANFTAARASTVTVARNGERAGTAGPRIRGEIFTFDVRAVDTAQPVPQARRPFSNPINGVEIDTAGQGIGQQGPTFFAYLEHVIKVSLIGSFNIDHLRPREVLHFGVRAYTVAFGLFSTRRTLENGRSQSGKSTPQRPVSAAASKGDGARRTRTGYRRAPNSERKNHLTQRSLRLTPAMIGNDQGNERFATDRGGRPC